MNSCVDSGIKRWFWNQAPLDTKVRSLRVEAKREGREISLHFHFSVSSVSFHIKIVFLHL